MLKRNDPIKSYSNLDYGLEWIHAILAINNKLLPATCKVTLIALKYEVDYITMLPTFEERDDKLVPVSKARLGKRTGLSLQQIGDNLIAMANAGIIDRKLLQGSECNSQLCLALAPDTLRRPASVSLDKETGRGGKRTPKKKKQPMCKECGSYDVNIERDIQCRSCGSHANISVKEYHEPLDVMAPPANAKEYPPTFLELVQSGAIVPEEIPAPVPHQPPAIAVPEQLHLVQTTIDDVLDIQTWNAPTSTPIMCKKCSNRIPDRWRYIQILDTFECMHCLSRQKV